MYGLKHQIVEISGDVTDAGRTTKRTLKIELLSQWKLEAEFRNFEERKKVGRMGQKFIVGNDRRLGDNFTLR